MIRLVKQEFLIVFETGYIPLGTLVFLDLTHMTTYPKQYDYLICSFVPPKAAHCPTTVSRAEFQIAHGPSKFVKSEKVANLQRQENSTPGNFVAHCQLASICLTYVGCAGATMVIKALLATDLLDFNHISCSVWLPIEFCVSQLSAISQGTPVLVSLVKHESCKPLNTVFQYLPVVVKFEYV